MLKGISYETNVQYYNTIPLYRVCTPVMVTKKTLHKLESFSSPRVTSSQLECIVQNSNGSEKYYYNGFWKTHPSRLGRPSPSKPV